MKIKLFLREHGFWPGEQDKALRISLLTLTAFVIFWAGSFYTHSQIQERLTVSEKMYTLLYNIQYDFDVRLGGLEARYDARRRALLVFINNKHPLLDSAYVELLVNTIIKYSDQFRHIDPMLLTSLMWHESGFDTLAVSHKNAQGIMQILPSTAQAVTVQYGLSSDYNLLTLDDNTRIGCLYLNGLIARYGEFNALSHYYTGRVSNVGKWYATRITKFGPESPELSYD